MQTVRDLPLASRDRRAIEEAARMLRRSLPVEEVRLFGSKARGTDDADSDIDLLLLKSRPLSFEERTGMTDALFDLEMAHGVQFNPRPSCPGVDRGPLRRPAHSRRGRSGRGGRLTPEEARREVIGYWVHKAGAALESARSELGAGRTDFAAKRAYYAAFHVTCAVLLRDGHRFVKHCAARSALRRHYEKTGALDARWGRIFDQLFDSRQRGDYQELVEFDIADAARLVESAESFT